MEYTSSYKSYAEVLLFGFFLLLSSFSGSATLAHAVIVFNKERDCKVKFILTQIEENLDFAMSKASGKAKDKMKSAIAFLDSINKPHNVCEIGKERIRRAGQKIKEENPKQNLKEQIVLCNRRIQISKFTAHSA